MAERNTATFDLPRDSTATVRCVSCADRTCEALRLFPGILSVQCRSETGSISVEFDPRLVSETEIEQEMASFGARLADEVAHASWRLSGLD